MDITNDQDKIQIADQIIGIREVRGVFKKGTDTWKYEFPTPIKRAYIESEVAKTIGVPLETYNRAEYMTVQACVYLDNILIETPNWWKGAGECYDEKLIMDIFEKFLQDQTNFRRRLREGKFSRPGQSKAT